MIIDLYQLLDILKSGRVISYLASLLFCFLLRLFCKPVFDWLE